MQVSEASLTELFQHRCAQYALAPAFDSFGYQLTYHAWEQGATAIAAFLQRDCHVKKGDRIALILPNILAYPLVLMGAFLAGLVVVNINPLYTAPEMEHTLQDSGAKVAVILKNFTGVLESIRSKTAVEKVLVANLGDGITGFKRYLVNFVGWLKRKTPVIDAPDYLDLAIVLKNKKSRRPVSCEGTDIAFLQYTGGTTGKMKAAVLTHHNVIANINQCLTWLAPPLRAGAEVVVMPLPLYHIFSLTSTLFMVALGAKSILIANPRDLSSLIKAIRTARFSVFIGVNTLFRGLLDHPAFKQVDFSQLHLTFSGGMTLQLDIATEWGKTTGVPIIEGYGLTEASPVVTINAPEPTAEHRGIGFPVPWTEISIRDEQGEAVSRGMVGELWIRGPQVMREYWQQPAETLQVLTHDNWLKTGDLVSEDERGCLHLVDRKKDVIIVSGFNVYPGEVEAVLTLHPAVQEAGVVGVPCEETGEAVKAFVVLRSPVMAQALITFCHRHLTGYKVPHQIEFVAALPKSNVGKILRKELRHMMAS